MGESFASDNSWQIEMKDSDEHLEPRCENERLEMRSTSLTTTTHIPMNSIVTSSSGSALNIIPASIDGDENDSILLLERRSFRPFKSSEDYLYAMREDLAEWLNGLYDLNIYVDDFFERLENGVTLCEHANNVRRTAVEYQHKHPEGRKFSSKYEVPPYEVHYRRDSAPGSFFARDNVHNFIRWCRDLGVHDVLMFETDDLVLRKNEKHVILALLEIARRGARFGMAAPLLVQMEADIDREIEKDRLAMENQKLVEGQGMMTSWGDDTAPEEEDTPPNLIYGPQPQVVTNDLKSLDEMVRDLVERCNCPSQFPMIKVSEGKYRIGDTKVLIFVRILRNHVMVRVGGGWDTLHHYLDKHDPCRCRAGHRTTLSSNLKFKTASTGDRDLRSVSYKRSEEGFSPSSPALPRRKSGFGASTGSPIGLKKDSFDGRSSFRQRSQSPALRESPFSSGSPRLTNKLTNGREDSSAICADMWCDSSSEVSDEGYKSQGPPRPSLRSRRLSPLKPGTNDIIERPDSSMTQLSSEGSSVSTDDLGVPPSPPQTPPTVIPSGSRQWNSVPSKSASLIPRTSASKNKLPCVDTSISKKPKSKSVADPRYRAWNAGPGVKETEPRSRRSSLSEESRTICRSRSATSEGGFQSLLRKDSGGRQSLRSLPRSTRQFEISNGKNTWNGRSRPRDYPVMNAESFRPPPGTRSVRSASASPATTRRVFPSSAPVTPVNRSPKRSIPLTSLSIPMRPPPLRDDILPKKVEYDRDGENAELLAHIEDLVNDYRVKVYNMFLSEGKPLPPELSEEEWSKDSSTTPTQVNDPLKEIKTIPVKATPRKAGIGSRIPAPVF